MVRSEGWEYTVLPSSELIRKAEVAGLEIQSFARPDVFQQRFIDFYENSRMKEWHPPHENLWKVAIYTFKKLAPRGSASQS